MAKKGRTSALRTPRGCYIMMRGFPIRDRKLFLLVYYVVGILFRATGVNDRIKVKCKRKQGTRPPTRLRP